jgi:CRISPR-associated protein Cmr5
MSHHGNNSRRNRQNKQAGNRNARYGRQQLSPQGEPQQQLADAAPDPASAAAPVAAAPVQSPAVKPVLPPPLVALARGEAGPNRKQRVFRTVHERITGIASPANTAPAAAKQVFGNLCHSVPVLLGTNGLVQTIAFVEDKIGDQPPEKRGDRERAYELLRDEIAHLLDLPPADLLTRVRESDVLQYQRYTRTVLDAWIYYKRFAVTVLHVPPGGEPATHDMA